MFENRGNFKWCKIDFHLENILFPYWSLFVGIKGIKILDDIFSTTRIDALKRIKTNFLHTCEGNNIEKISDAQESAYNEVFTLLQRFVLSHLFPIKRLNIAFSKNILAAFKDEDALVVITNGCESEKIISAFTKLLTAADPISFILQILNPKKSATQLKQMVNTGLYELAAKDFVQEAEMRSLYAPIYHTESFNIDLQKIPNNNLDSTSFWINEKLINEMFKIYDLDNKHCFCFAQKEGELSLIKADGVALGNYLIPFKSAFHLTYTPNLRGYWENFKYGVYKRPKKEFTELESIKRNTSFLALSEKEDVTNTLSYLRDNLFLMDDQPSKEMEPFFHDVSIVKGLEEFDNYEFFSSQAKELNETFLGIHKKNKVGSKAYKLAHYIIRDKSGLKNYRGASTSSPSNVPMTNVKVLVPDVAYYYLRRFYEDFFEKALKTIKGTKHQLDFVTNQYVIKDKKENEIDVIAFNGKRIFFIELKTNLTIEYIMSYQEKCNRWIMDNNEIVNNLDFIIVGCYGKPSLNICKGPEDSHGLYNIPREGLNGCAYDFEVPLDKGKKLKCFTESSYEKLQNKIIEVLDLR